MPVIKKSLVKTNLVPMIILSGLFFIFGFVTWLNGILIPYLKIACELSDFQALFVTFAFYISYTVMALPSSYLIDKLGFKKGMVLGLWVMAVGTLIFVPAALSRTYLAFLAGLFVMGSGLALLQTASNPYVTVIGPKESAAKRISILGVCNKLAGAIAPLLLAYFIFADADSFVASLDLMSVGERLAALDVLASRVVVPYLVMTGILVVMGVAVNFAPLPAIDVENQASDDKDKKSLWAFPHLILGVVALFLYVGVEVVAGDTIIRYGQSLGIEMSVAKAFTSYTLLCMLVGYFIGITCIPRFMSQQSALKYSAILGLVFSLGAVTSSSVPSVIFIILLGLANALVWPAIWPLALDGLGRLINKGSALLIMAIAGGAILPLMWGFMSDEWGSKMAYWILVPAYLFILFYALRGYKLKTWK